MLSEIRSDQKTYYFYEVPRVIKLIEMKSRVEVARDSVGGSNGVLVFNWIVSV